jgi:xylanolytic transcriptional activator XlnR
MLYRLFGTYLLQSSFIFLILIRKLKDPDQYILSCCTTNLRALDAFVATVNISYQKTFARMLRETLSRRMNPQQDLVTDGSSSEQDDNLSPELLKYRWTPGFNGLWCEDMGRPKEAKMRKFTSIH